MSLGLAFGMQAVIFFDSHRLLSINFFRQEMSRFLSSVFRDFSSFTFLLPLMVRLFASYLPVMQIHEDIGSHVVYQNTVFRVCLKRWLFSLCWTKRSEARATRGWTVTAYACKCVDLISLLLQISPTLEAHVLRFENLKARSLSNVLPFLEPKYSSAHFYTLNAYFIISS